MTSLMTEKGEINWVETLAQIAEEKGRKDLANYVRAFGTMGPIPKEAELLTANKPDYSNLSSHFAKPSFNITKIPEATCHGCQ